MARQRPAACMLIEHETLATFAVNAPLSCLYVPDSGEFVAVGNANGGLRLFFMDSPGYKYVKLASQGIEGIRCMHYCPEEGALYVATGDRGVYTYDLQNLQADSEDPGNAACEKVKYDRVHSYGTCSHSIVLNHGKLFLLVLVGAVRVYSIDFTKMVVKKTPARGDSQEEEEEGLVPEQDAIEHKVESETTPCCFDGSVLVSLQHEKKRKWLITVVNWKDDRKVIRNIPVRFVGKNALRPSHISLSGGVVAGVLNERTIKLWDISSGGVIQTYTSSNNVAALTLLSSPEAEAPVVLYISTQGLLRVCWKGEEMHALHLEQSKATFSLNLVYVVRAEVGWKGGRFELKTVFYSDDTGVHVLRFKEE